MLGCWSSAFNAAFLDIGISYISPNRFIPIPYIAIISPFVKLSLVAKPIISYICNLFSSSKSIRSHIKLGRSSILLFFITKYRYPHDSARLPTRACIFNLKGTRRETRASISSIKVQLFYSQPGTTVEHIS